LHAEAAIVPAPAQARRRSSFRDISSLRGQAR
jgi:hypothetical protein